MDQGFVEAIGASLIREYLSRKGFKQTLAMLDNESPRSEQSISNRPTLMKELHLEKLMKRNKEEGQPFRTMIEVMTKHFLEQVNERHSRTSSAALENNKTKPVSPKKEYHGDIIVDDDVEGETLLGDGKSGLMDQQIPDRPMSSRSNRSRGMSGPITSSLDPRDKRLRSAKKKHVGPGTLHGPMKDVLRSEDSASPSPVNTPERQHSAGATRKEPNHLSIDLKPLTAALEEEPQRKPSASRRRTSNSEIPVDPPETSVVSKPQEKPKNITPSEFRGDKKTSFEDSLKKLKENRTKRRDKEKVEIVTPQSEATQGVMPRPSTGRRKVETDESEGYSVLNSSLTSDRPPSRGRLVEQPSKLSKDNTPNTAESENNNATQKEESDVDTEPKLPPPQLISKSINSRPMDLKTAVQLKTILFGTAMENFNDEWRYQSLTFCDIPKLQYGIVQKKGGPCGALAAIQACMLQKLLFTDKSYRTSWQNPTKEIRSKCLAMAISNILWRAGEFSRAILTLPSGRTLFTGIGRFKADQLTETLTINEFDNYDTLYGFVTQHIGHLEMDGSGGVILVVYSAILSRGISQIKKDMDVPDQGKLMGQHGYCTQEMVNLLIKGQAASNVFDNTMELDGGLVLKGIVGRGDIGLLSLFEHYNSCQVGTNLKVPKNPIWLICSESHFTTLFCTRKELMSDWKAERRFDLYYYDGLAKQDEEIRLTIDTTNRFYEPPSAEDEMVPPLELCIRTKWKDAQIDWNGTEPFL
ncbi:unnamed protein product [Owenia fusiformis]|uniref:Ubiquitin carboxyl-terminal hydrolase MINDY n=1 Tax=Owenia fusiformis TaxID=6347 RepID=A0A8J1XRE3_OWEFU|nr:unnamed protein product [Owenia fusiformis]